MVIVSNVVATAHWGQYKYLIGDGINTMLQLSLLTMEFFVQSASADEHNSLISLCPDIVYIYLANNQAG